MNEAPTQFGAPGGGLQRAFSLHQQGHLEEAARRYRQLIEAQPEHFDAWHLSGMLALQQGDAKTAVERLERATAIRPDVADPWCNLGLAQLTIDAPEEAIGAFQRALALDPALAPALHGIARAHLDAGHWQAALTHARRAVQRAPQNPNAWRVLGETQIALAAWGGAAHAYQQALQLQPRDAELAYNLGLALEECGHWQQALDAYGHALQRNPQLGPALSNLVFLKRSLCDWEGLDRWERRFRAGVQAGQAGLTPFALLAISNDRAEQRRCAETFAASLPRARTPFPHPRRRKDRITIGYLSSGYCRYPTATLIPGVIEGHDRSRFRVLGLSTGPDDGSDERRRLMAAFDGWLELRQMPPQVAAQRIFDAGVDILVDLKGHTNDAPTAITAQRPAPVQACWVGYPGTMGADFVDYLIADHSVIRDGEGQDYTEAVVRLSACYQPNDERRGVPEAQLTRADCDLPEDAPVLCCFNQSYKLGPETFAGWMAILKAVPKAVLWLLEPKPGQGITERLRGAAAAHGVSPERLVFAPKRPQAEYLDQLRLADLMLDTWPYNAHTTASDALWMGCPVLTCPGETFAGRVAASLLRAAGLEELIGASDEDLKRKTIALAGDRAALQRLRAHLENHRRQLPLFDSARITREVESAFATMLERWWGGLPPAPFSVGSGGLQ